MKAIFTVILILSVTVIGVDAHYRHKRDKFCVPRMHMKDATMERCTLLLWGRWAFYGYDNDKPFRIEKW